MALSITLKHLCLALAVLFIFVSLGKFGKAAETPPEIAAAGVLANEYFPGKGGANQNYPETGTVDDDPEHIVAKALLCFDQKQIYSSCNEEYRLSVNGELHVPQENTEQYCTGPCVYETDLVLKCIEGLLLEFKFYNKATISDVRDTIKSGCSHGPKRGNFNVAERVQDKYSDAHKTYSSLFLSGLLSMMVTCRLLF